MIYSATFICVSILYTYILGIIERNLGERGCVGKNVEETQARAVLLSLVLLSLTLISISSDIAVWPSHRRGVRQKDH